MINIRPLPGIGEIGKGDDIGAILAAALADMQPEKDDILVVTSKIVSKAEGQAVRLESVTPGAKAKEIANTIGKDARLIELVLTESTDIVRAARGVLITRHRQGLVMANAGIDCSNVGPDSGEIALLLPINPDDSAQRIADAIKFKLGVELGVILSDSFGRPWRHGVVNVAIGAAGVPSLIDRRGEVDRDGRVLQSTVIATADLIASAAGLAMGEADEGVPAALVSGLALTGEAKPASSLIRPVDEDLFR